MSAASTWQRIIPSPQQHIKPLSILPFKKHQLGVYGLLRASCREYYTSEALAAISDISWTINENVNSSEQAANPGDGCYICTSKDLVMAFGDTKMRIEARYFQIDHESGPLHNPLSWLMPTQTTNRYKERRHHMLLPQMHRLEHHNTLGLPNTWNYAPNIREINLAQVPTSSLMST